MTRLARRSSAVILALALLAGFLVDAVGFLEDSKTYPVGRISVEGVRNGTSARVAETWVKDH